MPDHDLARRLGLPLTERQRKRYRTGRRRIRSYFGSAAAISHIAVTVGSRSTPLGLLCGFVFRLSGNSGVKGLRASEGYCLVPGVESDDALPVLHAMRDQFLLQLDQLPTDLFIIPPGALALSRDLSACDSPVADRLHEGLRQLLHAVPRLTAHPCVKGPFHGSMQAKLDQLARNRGNETTRLDVDQITTSLLNQHVRNGYVHHGSVQRPAGADQGYRQSAPERGDTDQPSTEKDQQKAVST
jgi:hypothetical protein